jgi:hypothetical protein
MNSIKLKTMKNTFLTLAIASTLFISCGEDDTADIIIYNTDNSVTNNNNGGTVTPPTTEETINISGTYITDLTLLASNNYLLNGPLVMASGTTLTIEAGTTIEALASGSDMYIAISQGAKIEANGTAEAPIIMTSNSAAPKAGDWGGLILLGKAPINSVAAGGTSTSEIGGLPYGGTDAADNSGTIRYVRVQYSGGKADGQSENNGFSFYGVGNGTTVEYIEMYEGLDDGLEFFGGTVNVSYVYVVNAQDDSIDWTEGYTGTISNAYIKHGIDHDKAFECDGYNTDIGNNSNPVYFSAPNVNNVTIDGLTDITGNEAVRLRAGTQGIFTNLVINNFEEAFDLDGDTTGDNPTGQGVLDDALHVNDIIFNNVTVQMKNDTGYTFTEADFISNIGSATGTDYETWGAGWTVK